MKLWLIFIQADGHTWLEAAWDDESTAENHAGWQEEVERCHGMAAKENYEIRVVSTHVAGVFELFDAPHLKSNPAVEAS